MDGTVNQAIALVHRVDDQNDLSKNFLVRKTILNHFFRFESLLDNAGKVAKLSHFVAGKVAKETQTSSYLVLKTLEDFLARVTYFKQFLESGLIVWAPKKQQLYRKARVYLHKAHKLAPVFDYARARKNLGVLHVLLARKFFWPHITTQLALVIFVTDRNDPSIADNNYILQKNLRTLCSCSAYAFHMARNKLKINKLGVLS